MKKVLITVPTMSGGGAERVVAVILNNVDRDDLEIDLLLNERRSDEYHINGNVNIFSIDEVRSKNRVLDVLRYIKKIKRIRQVIKDGEYDIIVPFLHSHVINTYIANVGLKSRFVFTVTGNVKYFKGLKSMILSKLQLYIARKSDAVFLQTNEQKSFFSKRIHGKCFVIPNPVSSEMLDVDVFSKDEIKNVITAGRLVDVKNQEMLINSFAKVKSKNIKLKIYGEGPLQKQLEAQIKSLNLQSNVFLMGRSEDMKDTLANADLFVLTSNVEGLPNALIEAMATGRPCISTNCKTGPLDIIDDGVNGIIVEVGNENALTNAIDYLLANVDKAREFAIKAKESAKEKFETNNVVGKFIKEMNNL